MRLLKDFNPDFKAYSKQEIIDKSNQFRYKNIIRFINNKINKEKSYSRNAFILSMIPEYSDLSSFVHGGPNSDKYMADNYSEENRKKELTRIIELAFLMSSFVKMLSLLTYYQYEKRIGNAYLIIEQLMKKNNR